MILRGSKARQIFIEGQSTGRHYCLDSDTAASSGLQPPVLASGDLDVLLLACFIVVGFGYKTEDALISKDSLCCVLLFE